MDVRIMYDMSQAWFSDEEALDGVNVTSSFSEINKAFDAPAFTGSWGRGGPRPNIRDIKLPKFDTQMKQPQQGSNTFGKGRGCLLDVSDDEFPKDDQPYGHQAFPSSQGQHDGQQVANPRKGKGRGKWVLHDVQKSLQRQANRNSTYSNMTKQVDFFDVTTDQDFPALR